MFVWSVPSVLSEFNRHTPELASFISQVRAQDNFDKTVRERFTKLPRISFDYAIMEKADRVLVVEATFDWDDVGSWSAVAKYFKSDGEGNAANCEITALDSTNNIVFNPDDTRIALLGVHNLIVVRTGDAVLICHRHQAEKIKKSGRPASGRIAMSSLPIRRRILGVDFGRARIGVAVSDELGLLAHPVETIPAHGNAAKRIDEIVAGKECGTGRDWIASPYEREHG